MTILELIEKIKDLAPDAEIEESEDDGELIVRTGLKIRNGELVQLIVGTKAEEQ